MLLRDRGANARELLNPPELEIRERFMGTRPRPTFAGVGAPTHTYVRIDRDPDISTTQLVAQLGGNARASGVSQAGAAVPPSIDGLAGIAN